MNDEIQKNDGKGCPTVLFSSLSFFGGTQDLLLDLLRVHLEKTRGEDVGLWTVFTPNPEQMIMAWENPVFLQALKRADFLLPDGAGVVWALRRSKQQTAYSVQRIPGRKIFHELLAIAREKKLKVFLLGGRLGAAKKIIEDPAFSTLHSQLGWNFYDGPRENREEALQTIAQEKPDMLFVAYGAPWQELWIDENRETLEQAGVRIAMVVGGAFEYEAGMVPRVPPVVEKLHLEWLQRLLTQPWRWRRQLKGLQFFWKVLLFSRHS